MTEILKRLEIIKSSIAIEDEEIIELQILKLSKFDIDDDVKTIIEILEEKNYSQALLLLNEYLVRYSGVVSYVDTELQALKLEAKSLEEQLQKLVEEKTEYLNEIDEFNTHYSLRLGEIIKSILGLKKKILAQKFNIYKERNEEYKENLQTIQETKENIEELKTTIDELESALKEMDKNDPQYDEVYEAYRELKEELNDLEKELAFQESELDDLKQELDNDTIEEEFEESTQQYNEFEQEYEDVKEASASKFDLSDEEKKELKKLYRKAARLCHPDTVSDELKEKATQIMQKLNDAYEKQDLLQIKEILYKLESGQDFDLSSDVIEDKELLKEKISEYKQHIKEVKDELTKIKSDDVYIIISELDDWDEYFERVKDQLLQEEAILKEKYENPLSEKTVEKTIETKDDYWESEF